MHEMINSKEDPVDVRDLSPYTFPNKEELDKLNYSPACLGSFIPWDYVSNTKLIKKELGWKSDQLEGVPDELNPQGEKIECFMQGTRDYVKYLKRGYSRITQINSFNVRNNRITPQEAKKLNEELDGRKPPSLEIFLEYTGLTEKEFNQLIDRTVIPPNIPCKITVPNATNPSLLSQKGEFEKPIEIACTNVKKPIIVANIL